MELLQFFLYVPDTAKALNKINYCVLLCNA